MPERPTALITGGAKRVGRAVALRLADAGFDLIVTYRRSRDEAESMAREARGLGASCVLVQADFAEPEAGAAAVADAVDRAGVPLRVLVHNASIFGDKPLAEIDGDHARRMFCVNALAPLLLTRRLAARLAEGFDPDRPETAGRVVAFGDIHVMHRPMAGYTAYAMSKAAVLQMVESLAVELAPAVTVNAIAPGVVAWAAELDEQHRRAYLARTPLDRAGTPDDAAEAAAFLVTQAHYTTGQVLRVDGGRWLT